jgi:hypothetical protein
MDASADGGSLLGENALLLASSYVRVPPHARGGVTEGAPSQT